MSWWEEQWTHMSGRVRHRDGNRNHRGPWKRLVSRCDRAWSRGRREDNAGRPSVGWGERRRSVKKSILAPPEMEQNHKTCITDFSAVSVNGFPAVMLMGSLLIKLWEGHWRKAELRNFRGSWRNRFRLIYWFSSFSLGHPCTETISRLRFWDLTYKFRSVGITCTMMDGATQQQRGKDSNVLAVHLPVLARRLTQNTHCLNQWETFQVKSNPCKEKQALSWCKGCNTKSLLSMKLFWVKLNLLLQSMCNCWFCCFIHLSVVLRILVTF